MTPVLYQFASSPFTEKVRRALNYKGIAFEVHEVDRAAIPAGKYAAISASGKFPALVLGDEAIQDSTEILEAIERHFPERPVIPHDPAERARAHVLEDWADESLYFYEMTVRLAWEHNLEPALDVFAQGMPGIPREALRTAILDGVTKLVIAQGLGRKSQAAVVADMERHFSALEVMLSGRDWLVADHPSNADLAVAAQINAILFSAEGKQILERCPAVDEWLRRLDRTAPSHIAGA